MIDELTLTNYQNKVASIPESHDVFLGGGRGGGKTTAAVNVIACHLKKHGKRAHVLILRKTYKGLNAVVSTCHEIFRHWFGDYRYNGADHVFRFASGATAELGQLETETQYDKYQGQNYTLIYVDEAGHFADARLIDRMRSNLRGPRGVPTRFLISANPGHCGHWHLAKRYVITRPPWMPFVEEVSNRKWVYAPSTYLDNRHIDQEGYLTNLRTAANNDEELLKAWRDGDWNVARGAFFAAVLDEKRVMVEPFDEVPKSYGQRWSTWLSHDFGTGAPSVTYLLAESPGAEVNGRYFSRGSIVAIAELATAKKDHPNEGFGWTAARIGEEIKAKICERWGVEASGFMDDANFARTGTVAGSVADEFARVGVHFQRAMKGRRAPGWQKMARMFADAGKTDVPGLFVARNCRYFWETAPYLERDEFDSEDLDSDQPDHGVDSLRYGIMRVKYAMSINLGFAR